MDELLSSKFTLFIEVECETATKTAVAQQQLNLIPLEILSHMSESLKVIADKMVIFEQQQQTIAEQDRRIANLEAEIQSLKESQQTATQQQSHITLQAEDVQTKEKSWFWSVFKR